MTETAKRFLDTLDALPEAERQEVAREITCRKAEPSADSLFHCSLLLSVETAKTTDQFHDGQGHDAVSIEGSGPEEANGDGYLEA